MTADRQAAERHPPNTPAFPRLLEAHCDPYHIPHHISEPCLNLADRVGKHADDRLTDRIEYDHKHADDGLADRVVETAGAVQGNLAFRSK
jgi:hypothetical protein